MPAVTVALSRKSNRIYCLPLSIKSSGTENDIPVLQLLNVPYAPFVYLIVPAYKPSVTYSTVDDMVLV